MFRLYSIKNPILRSPNRFGHAVTPFSLLREMEIVHTCSPQPRIQYLNFSTTAHNLSLNSYIRKVINRTLDSESKKEEPKEGANDRISLNKPQESKDLLSGLKNAFFKNSNVFNTSYVGLIVALDAKHAEKAWSCFSQDYEKSLFELAVTNQNSKLWERVIENPQLIKTLDSSKVAEVKHILIQGTLVCHRLLKVFAREIQRQNYIISAESAVGNSNENDLHLSGRWGYRVSFVLNQLFSIKEWSKNIENFDFENDLNNAIQDFNPDLYEIDFEEYDTILDIISSYSIQKGYTGNTYPLIHYLKSDFDKDTSSKFTSDSDYFASAPLSLVRKISSIHESPVRLYTQTLKLMSKNYEISTKNIEDSLLLCLQSGDLVSAIEILKTFSNISTNDLIEIARTFKEKASHILPADIDISAENPTELPPQIDPDQVVEFPSVEYLEDILPFKIVPSSLMMYAIIGKIVLNLDPTKHQLENLSECKNQMNIAKNNTIKGIYHTVKKILDSDPKLQQQSVLPMQINLQNYSIYKNLASELNNGLYPTSILLSQLILSSLCVDDVPEALNAYESLKLFSLTINPNPNSDGTELESSDTGYYQHTISISVLEEMAKIAAKNGYHWLVSLILFDLKDFGYIPSKQITTLYFYSLINNPDFKLESFTRDIFKIVEFYKSETDDSTLATLLSEIYYSLADNNIVLSLDSLLNKNESYSKFNPLIDIYNKYYSESGISDSFEVTSALVKSLCSYHNEKWIEAAKSVIEKYLINNPEFEQILTVELMDAYNRVGDFAKALERFVSYLDKMNDKEDTFSIDLDLYGSAMKSYYLAKDYAQVIDIGKVIIGEGNDVKISKTSENADEEADSFSMVSGVNLKEVPEFVFDLMTDSYCKLGMMDPALRFLAKIRTEQIKSTSFMYASLISAYGRLKLPRQLALIAALANMDSNLSSRDTNYSVSNVLKKRDESIFNNTQPEVVDLDAHYYTALLESLANNQEKILAHQAWELACFKNIYPTPELVKAIFDLIGWSERKDYLDERTLMKHTSATFEDVSRNRKEYFPDSENPNAGRMPDLYKLGYVLEYLEKKGYELTTSNVKSLFEVLCKVRLYQDAVDFLINNKKYIESNKIMRKDNIDPTLEEDSLYSFAKNMLSLAGSDSLEAMEILECDISKIK
ncbi:hypothetical protein BB560_000268 [Smittium megazygosporum]|uniref:Pentacotripeptide-repeat region of PRORP domain-containing protein n=1 Tax=Smittium megazygosporum TaxID=133381 RepID=A0A2T9ZKV3_9FUNG|nr:hypothetical protein BB560_000268 [Smittium megazygosporum]